MTESGKAVSMALPSRPYRGIEPFRFLDQPIYIGRESEVRNLVRLITIYRGILFYGDSGVGKSSLINAGLIPSLLDEGFKPERLRVQPVADKEVVLERISLTDEGVPPFLPSSITDSVGDGEAEPARVVWSLQAFADQMNRFRRSASDCASSNAVEPVVLIFDQFEEIITLVDEATDTRQKFEQASDVRRKLLDQIIALFLDQELAVKLIFSFREDYLAKVVRLFQAVPALQERTLRLTPLPATALRNIIRRPFENAVIPSGHFERRLSEPACEALEFAFKELSDTGTVNLTEVQIACLALYEDPVAESRFVDDNDHRGAVRRLFGTYLDRVLNRLSQSLRALAIIVLTRLVTSSGTRNIVSEDDLVSGLKGEANVSESDTWGVLEALTATARLIFRQTRGDTAFYEITSEFLIPWIREKRQAREEADLRRRLSATTKQRTVACVVACFCLLLAGFSAWEWWQYQIEKKHNVSLNVKNGALQNEINAKEYRLVNLNSTLKDQDAQLANRDSLLANRDALLANRDAQLRELDGRLTDGLKTLSEMSNQRDQLQAQLAQVKSSAQDILRKMEQKLEETTEINALLVQDSSTWQDPRARVQPFLNLGEVDLLQSAFTAIRQLPLIISGTVTGNSPAIGRGEVLMAESRSMLAVLAGRMDRAIEECNQLLNQPENLPRNLEQPRAELLKIRGDIFGKRGFLNQSIENYQKDTNHALAREDWNRAVQDLKEARDLADGDSIFEARVLLSLSDVQRQLSLISAQRSDVEQQRNQALTFAEQATRKAEAALEKQDSADLHFLLQDAYRKIGNVQIDRAVDVNGAGQRQATIELAWAAIRSYLESLEQSELGERLLPDGCRQEPVYLTAQVGKVFSQANLAEAYKVLLEAGPSSSPDRAAIQAKCVSALEERIATCRELVKSQTSNRYFWTLLSRGYRNRGEYYLNLRSDRNIDETKEKAFEDIRIAYLVAFPAVDRNLELDYEKAVANRFGQKAENQVAKLNEGALDEILPLIQKEQNTEGQSSAGYSHN